MAVTLVQEVEQSLDGLELGGTDVQDWRAIVPALYRAVMSYATPWNSNVQNPVDVISDNDLAHLRTLGVLLTSVGYSPNPEPDAEQVNTLLTETYNLIAETPDLPDPERRYLLGLINEARQVVSEVDVFGWATARRVVFQLTGAMQSQAGVIIQRDGNGNRAKVWFGWAMRLGLAVASGLGLGAGEALAENAWGFLELPPGDAGKNPGELGG